MSLTPIFNSAQTYAESLTKESDYCTLNVLALLIRSGLYTRRTYRSSLYCWLALGNDFIRRGGTFEGLSILNMSMHALLVAMLAFLAWIYLKRILRYRSNPLACLPGPPGGSLMKGHFDRLFNLRGWDFHKEIAKRYGSVMVVEGPLWSKSLFVHDPKALHHIFVRDQDVFEETEGFFLGSEIIFGRGLFAAIGDAHRKQRKMLNPVFSVKHLKEMVPIFFDVANRLQTAIDVQVKNGPQEIDMLHWMSRTALELIGQSGFGYSFDSLTEDKKEHIFSAAIKNFNGLSSRLIFLRQFVLPYVYHIGSPRFRRWVVNMIPSRTVRDFRDLIDVMHTTSQEIVQTKKHALSHGRDNQLQATGIGRGKDLMSVLLRANMSAAEEDKLTDDELVAQVSGLVFAATDTTSNALAQTLHVLSQRQDAQDKLREEIRNAHAKFGTERLEYDEIVSLPYLDAVCRETLRIRSPVHTVIRETRSDIVLPFSKPIHTTDGRIIEEIMVPKGTKVFPSLLSSNRNPDIWGADADEWMPERWIQGLPDSVADAKIPGVYAHLMTFIGGGRACIGFKFSQLELKVVLCTLLSKFRFRLTKEREIEWRMTGVVTPVVKGSMSGLPELPLVVEAL